MNRSKQTNTLRNRHRQSSLIPPTAMYSAHPIQRPRRASHSALETQRLNPGLYPIAPMPVLLRQDVPTARPPSTLAYQQQGVPVSAPPPLLHQQHVPPTAQYSLPPVPPNKYYENEAYQQRSAIDILASAAEYIRTDRKELGSSRI